MQDVVRDGMEAGALGLSVSRNQGHFDPQGVHIPALWADEKEIFALADVLREMGTGIIQSGGGHDAEMKDGLMAGCRRRPAAPVVYNNLGQTMRRPGEWKKHMARVERDRGAGHPRLSDVHAEPHRRRLFTMKNTQVFRGLPTWHPILLSSDEEKLKAYADPEVRAKLHEEAVECKVGSARSASRATWWNYIWVEEPSLDKNKRLRGQDARPDRQGAGQGHHRLRSSISSSRKSSTPHSAGREQRRRRRDAPDPELSRTPSSASSMAARTCSSTAATGSRPGSSASGCARSR